MLNLKTVFTKNATWVLLLLFLFNTVVVISTYAWMSSNRQTDQENGPMALAFDDTTARYEFYRFDIQQNEGVVFTEGISSIEFNPYDLIFASRNRYTPIFVRIQIQRMAMMPEDGTLYLTIGRTPHGDASSDSLSEYCSSIMRFTSLIDNKYLDHVGDAHALYLHVDEELYARTKSYRAYYGSETPVSIPETSKTFTSYADGTYTKTENVTLTIPYTSVDWVDETHGDSTVSQILNVILYITYDEGLIELFKNGGGVGSIQSLSSGDNTITFNNDLTAVSIAYAAE